MTAPRVQDVFLYGGGRCAERFGTPFLRLSRAQDVPAVFTRAAGDAASLTPSGVREYSANRLRTEYVYNPSSGLYERAISIAPLSSNDCLRSQELDNAAWTLLAATIVANNGEAPDSTQTADRIQETAVTTSHGAYQAWTPAADAEAIWHGFLRAQQLTQVRLDMEGPGNTHTAIMNLTGDGTLGNVSGSARPFIRRASPDWYHCGVAGNVGSGGNTPLCHIRLTDGAEGVSYAGNTANGLLAWGWTFIDGEEHIGPYLPTVAAARSMLAETLYCPIPVKPFAFTLLLDFLWGVDGYVATLDTIAHIGGAGTTAPRFQVNVTSGDQLSIDHDNGVDATATATSAALTTPRHGDRLRVMARLNADGSVQGAHTVNGGAVATWGPSAAPDAGLAAQWDEGRFYPFHYNGDTAAARLFRVVGARGAYTYEEMLGVLA